MRLLPYLFVFFIISCQKAVQSDPSQLMEAEFIVDSVRLFGDWEAGEELSTDNYLMLHLKVTSPGLYVISSAVQNGFSFTAQGEWVATGTISAKIPATGKPLEEGATEFHMLINDRPLTIVVNVEAATVTIDPEQFVEAPQGWLFSQTQKQIIGSNTFLMRYEQGTTRLRQIIASGFPHINITYTPEGTFDEIRYTYGNANGSTYPYKMVYDENGRVSKVMRIGSNQQFSVADVTYTYNPDGTLHTKFDDGDIHPMEYFYTDGNLTKVVYALDTTLITYDDRINRFNEIYPQYYFLDQMNKYDARDLAEMFYFSKNYPTSFGARSVYVEPNWNGLPGGIYLDGELQFSYGFRR